MTDKEPRSIRTVRHKVIDLQHALVDMGIECSELIELDKRLLIAIQERKEVGELI